MDRSWITLENHNTSEFKNGLNEFIKFVEDHKDPQSDQVYYLCKVCNNLLKVDSVKELKGHIICNGIIRTYTEWYWHGEKRLKRSFETSSMNDDTGHPSYNESTPTDMFEDILHAMGDNLADAPQIFNSLVHESEKLLYLGCTKFTN